MSQQRWQQLTEWPLVGAAVVFLAAYSVEVIADLHGAAASICDLVLLLTWIVFAIDYLVELVLAESRVRWFLRHLPDLAIVILPAVRPLRLLRLVNLLAALNKASGRVVRERVIVFAAATTALVVYVGAVAELDAERGRGRIETFGDALWWAITTICTVGYGDYVPQTFEGRVVAVVVMGAGIALLGIVTATLASWIVQRVNDVDEAEQAATRHQVELLSAEITALRGLLIERTVTGPRLIERGPERPDRARDTIFEQVSDEDRAAR